MSIHEVILSDNFEEVLSHWERLSPEEASEAISSIDAQGRTPLHLACSGGNVEIVAWLLTVGHHSSERSMELNVVDYNGETPLLAAAANAHLVVCQLLLNNGANAAVVRSDGCTAIHLLAATRPDKQIAQNLALVEIMKSVRMRADANGDAYDVLMAPNDAGDTPLHMGARVGNGEVVRMLLAMAADRDLGIDSPNLDGDGPIHLAVKNGHAAVLKLLMQHHREQQRKLPGALATDLSKITGKDGLTVEEMAKRFHHEDLLALLQLDAHAELQPSASLFSPPAAREDPSPVQPTTPSAVDEPGEDCHFIEHAKPRPAASYDPMDEMGSAPGSNSPPMRPRKLVSAAAQGKVRPGSTASASAPTSAQLSAATTPQVAHSPPAAITHLARESRTELEDSNNLEEEASAGRETLGIVQRCNLLGRVYPSQEYELLIIAAQVSDTPLSISFSPHIRVEEALADVFRLRHFSRTPSAMLQQLDLSIPPRSADPDGLVWMNRSLFLWQYDLKSGDVLSLKRRPPELDSAIWIRVLVPAVSSYTPQMSPAAARDGQREGAKSGSAGSGGASATDLNKRVLSTIRVTPNTSIHAIIQHLAKARNSLVNIRTCGLFLCTNSISEQGHLFLNEHKRVRDYGLQDMDVLRVGEKPLFELHVRDVSQVGSLEDFEMLGDESAPSSSAIDRQLCDEKMTVAALVQVLALVVQTPVDETHAGLFSLRPGASGSGKDGKFVQMPSSSEGESSSDANASGSWLDQRSALGECLIREQRLLFGEPGKQCIAMVMVVRDPFQYTPNVSKLAKEVGVMPGEESVLEVDDVSCYTAAHPPRKNGSLLITNARILFLYRRKMGPYGFVEIGVEMPLATVGRIQMVPDRPFIDISGRDLRTVRFEFGGDAPPMVQERVYRLLDARVFPRFPQELFAFFYKPAVKANGWGVYDIQSEFSRQLLRRDLWRISTINWNYGMADTYPPLIAVPTNVPDDSLRPVAAFRSKGRIPVMVYFHPNGATVTRSSQPMVGITQKRCVEDEELLAAVRRANPANDSELVIFDARPMKNAIANTAMGMGFERITATQYRQCSLQFLNVENIHVMRDSLHNVYRLAESSAQDDKNWYSQLENTNWLQHLKLLLKGAVKIAKLVDRDAKSVLIHCSDGWDRTPQLTSLVQLLLSPYYRTVIGFEVLIEKEWLSFGHKFDQRVGFRDRNFQDSQRSPIFLQFIDCVWQCVQQFPCSFEFSEKFLIHILDHLYSCYYGTFLFNTAKERQYANLCNTTVSLWSEVNTELDRFTNPFYLPGTGVLYPNTHYDSLMLWRAYYCRWSRPPPPGLGVTADLRCWQLILSHEQLSQRVSQLEKELEQYKKAEEERKALAETLDGAELQDGRDGKEAEAIGEAEAMREAEAKTERTLEEMGQTGAGLESVNSEGGE